MAGPLDAGPLDYAVVRPGSYAEIGVFLPMPVLQEIAALAVPAKLSGRVDDWAGDALKDDVLTWSATPRDLEIVSRDGGLYALARLSGLARIVGTLDLGIVKSKDEGQVAIAAQLSAQIGVAITPDYRFDLSLAPMFDVSEASASIFGISFSARGLLTGWLESRQGAFEAELEALVNEAVDLHAEIGESWGRLCQREALEFAGGRRVLVVDPVALVMTQPEVTEAGVQARVAVRAETRLVEGAAPGCPELPEMLELQ